MATTLLETDGGLSLTPLASSDAEDLHRLWTSEGVRRFLWDGAVIPLQQTKLAIDTSERLFAEHGFGLWGARRREDPALIGFGGFWFFRDPPELELLYGIAEDRWNRGHATDVAGALVRYGFDTLRMSAIRASTDTPNVSSVRVLEKLAFHLTRRATVGGLDTVFYEKRAA